MSSEQQEVAELVRSGRYFDEARGWYKALYIGPISERSFFLVIAVLATLVSLMALAAVDALLPLHQQVGLLMRNPDIDRRQMSLVGLRPQGKSLNSSLEKFFVVQYVLDRESYLPVSYAADSAFVRAHSDANVLAQYDALYSPANPRSPANILGNTGKRLVSIGDVKGRLDKQFHVGTVKFSTALEGVGIEAKTQWTATVSYYYSPLRTKYGPDGLYVQDPQFKVVSYAVTQTP